MSCVEQWQLWLADDASCRHLSRTLDEDIVDLTLLLCLQMVWESEFVEENYKMDKIHRQTSQFHLCVAVPA